MRAAFIAIAVLAAAPLTAAAVQQGGAPSVPGKPDPSLATAGTYTVDSGHSQVLFTVNHLGFSEYTGQFTNPTGTLTLDPANPSASKVEVTFPIDKVSTTVPALDAHLKKPEFFDAAQFPTAKFVSTRVEASGTSAKISGNLTIKGVTKPVVLDARFVGAGKAVMGPPKTNVGFSATTTVKRSDFGVNYGIPMVSDDVRLVINAAFVAQ